MTSGSGRTCTATGGKPASGIVAVIERAPAKINLALHVIGRRGDGYHELQSLVTFANVCDRVRVCPAESDSLTVRGPFAGALGDPSANLAIKARDALRRLLAHIDGAAPPVAIELEKNLPVAGGIGGGSADAAATLRALMRLWNNPATPAELDDLGRAIGADVPMCLVSRPLRAAGIGERLKLLAPFPAFDIVLVNPGRPVSTPAVFETLTSRENPPLQLPRRWGALGDCVAALKHMRNDLEATGRAIAPEIGEAQDALMAAGGLWARMSGSGPTCVGIFSGAETARRAANLIRRRHPSWFVVDCRTFYGVSGADT